MKYGVLIPNYGHFSVRMPGYNVGDGIQTQSVYELYKYMGIEAKEIVEIGLCELVSYQGEYVVLPIIGVAVGIQFATLPLSPCIIPVFVGIHIAINELTECEISYLKQYEPIGCRDEFTLKICRKYGVASYLSGCITLILNKRDSDINTENNVYCVDVPEVVMPFIESRYDKVVCKSHLLPLPKHCMSNNDAHSLMEISRSYLSDYSRNCRLMISSRLHALAPCIAMGIPVIGIFENISYRFSFLDKYIRLHSVDDIDKINWEPRPIELGEVKDIIRQVFAERIRRAYYDNKKLYSLSEFYERREKSNYGSWIKNKLKSLDCELNDYIIWGCGLIGSTVYNAMSELYPDARCIAAVDSYKTGKFNGITIIKPEELSKYKSFCVIAMYSGREVAKKLLKEMGRVEGKDFIYVGTANG